MCPTRVNLEGDGVILVDDLVDRGPHSADQHEAHHREDADRGRPSPIGAAEE